MGIKEENWQAGVGIITGIFAKEVLVATFNNLYSPAPGESETPLAMKEVWQQAIGSITSNVQDINPDDPLGVDVGEISDLNRAAVEQDVRLSTYQHMQNAFDGQLGAFSYLVFILLYTPCVAAMGAIKNEVGPAWAGFAAVWSFTLAYCAATLCYQIGQWSAAPVYASTAIAVVLLCFIGIYALLKRAAKRRKTLPVVVKYS
jgi:ferrous iron transport protein B